MPEPTATLAHPANTANPDLTDLPARPEAPALTPIGNATTNVAGILAEAAKAFGDKTALILGEEHLSFFSLWEQAKAYAGALRDRGIGPGDRVAMLMPNIPDFARTYFAALSLGAIVVPVHALLKAEEIEYVLRDSGSILFVVAAPLLEQGAAGASLAGVPVLSVLVPDDKKDALPFPRLEDEARAASPIDTFLPRKPDDTATILYTSGTTGRPKGAMGSHYALVEQTSTLLTGVFSLTSDDIILGCLPLFHTFGQTCVMNVALRAGATVVLVPKFDGDTALALLNKHQVTIMTGVPTMYIGLIDAASRNPERPPLRYGTSGGSALPMAVIGKMSELFGITVHEGYGLTETSPVATFNHYGRVAKPGTVGQAIWGVDVTIADSSIEDRIVQLAPNELGEIIVRGNNLFQGYLGLAEASRQAMVDGWFRTGDLGTIDEEGYVTIVDRKKDMIVRNGYNVYPREVEEVLMRHPAVLNAAVFGVHDDVHGQEVVGAATLMSGAVATGEELVEFVKERVAAYKYPRRITIVDTLPLGASGKVLKRVLVEQFE